MRYKLFLEDGDYRDKTTLEPRNMLWADNVYTPEGINVGWDEFYTRDEAMTYYNIELKPVVSNEEIEETE